MKIECLTTFSPNWQEKTLKAYRRDDLDETGGATDISAHEHACLTFQEVNDSSVKNKVGI